MTALFFTAPTMSFIVDVACRMLYTKDHDSSAISRNIGIVIPAIKPAGEERLMFNPSPDRVIQPADTLITFGTPEQIRQLKRVCTLK